jgi:hypothetical protein
MKNFRDILDGAKGPIGLVAVGTLMLAAVVIPSPARLSLLKDHSTAFVDTPFPDSPRSISEADFAAIVERPLFNSDRKKDPPPEAQTALPEMDSYRLAGVIIAGTTNIAIIERKKAKTSTALKVGDVLDGRTVRSITAQGVTLSYGDRSEVLSVPKIQGASLTTDAPNTNTPTSTNGGGG